MKLLTMTLWPDSCKTSITGSTPVAASNNLPLAMSVLRRVLVLPLAVALTVASMVSAPARGWE